MKIAVDAMGGDHAPQEIVKGAILASELFPEIEKIFLVGSPTAIEPLIEKRNDKLEIVPASEAITMEDHPGIAFRRKKDASITVAAKLVKSGEACALVSAGSTGAQMVASLFTLGRIKGIERPAIAIVLPTLEGGKLLLDAGANADCKVHNLIDFAKMGNIYAKKILGIENPRIGLINIGSEATKGNELSIKAFEELSKINNINFIGNIEGRDIPQGKCDVFVCDGFVGNVILKLMEGMAKAFGTILKEEANKSIRTKAGAALMLPALKGIKNRMDYAEYGGAPLLGVDGISIICHGSSKAKAIANAIRVAGECYSQGFINALKQVSEV